MMHLTITTKCPTHQKCPHFASQTHIPAFTIQHVLENTHSHLYSEIQASVEEDVEAILSVFTKTLFESTLVKKDGSGVCTCGHF